jgi:long-chain acyl-CoA synthetase
MKKKTLIDLFNESVTAYADRPFLWERKTRYQSTSYRESHQQVLELAAGFTALGLRKGDRVSLLAEGCNHWILTELGLLYAGGVNVPLSVKLVEAYDLQFRINHSEARFVVVSTTQLPKIRSIRQQVERVERIIVFGDQPVELNPGEMWIQEVYRLGKDYLKSHLDDVIRVSESVEGDDLANITYTSGTTADPKGVMLTHRNFTANVEQCCSVVHLPLYFRTLLILPLDHCFAHVTGPYTFMSKGGSLATVPVGRNTVENLRNIPLAIREFQPQVIMTVPALAKNFKNNVEKNVREQGAFAERLFRWAVRLSTAYHREGWNKGKGGTWVLWPLVRLKDALLFSKLRKSLGGKLEFFVDGGAYLDVEMQKFWYAVGLPMYQGYGLSEATPVISCNLIEDHKLGTSGKVVDGLEIAIRDAEGNPLPAGQKGEITVRGENVMRGYWKNPEATSRTIVDGWLWTGDLGSLDAQGFLNVFGRSKSLLIGSDGEKYSPEGIEETVTTLYPIVDQLLLFNNQHPYTTALVVPNKEALKRAVLAMDETDPVQSALWLIQNVFNDFRSGGKHEGLFPERWLPASFAVLEEGFTEKNGMMNSTMKLVRGKIEKAHAERLEYMLTPDGKRPSNEANLQILAALLK